MTFIPYDDKIEIKPFEKKDIILSQDQSLIEAGEVVAVGMGVYFVKVGEIIYFDSWGCSKTPPDEDGVVHYVVSENSQVILGKGVKE